MCLKTVIFEVEFSLPFLFVTSRGTRRCPGWPMAKHRACRHRHTRDSHGW